MNQEGISESKLSSKCDVNDIYSQSYTHNSARKLNPDISTSNIISENFFLNDSKTLEKLYVKLDARLLKLKNFNEKARLDLQEDIITVKISQDEIIQDISPS